MNNKSAAMDIRQLSNLCRRYMDRHSHKQYIDSLTGTNGWIIGYLHSQGNQDTFQRDLEKKFDITRSTASKVINLMISKGLIEHRSVDYDARLKKLVLTDKAKELALLMIQDGDMLEEHLCQGISPKEMEQFFKCLEKMKHNIKDNI